MSKISSAKQAEVFCGCSPWGRSLGTNHSASSAYWYLRWSPIPLQGEQALRLLSLSLQTLWCRIAPYNRVLCSRLSKRTFPPWTTERLKGERYGTHSLDQVCPERVFLYRILNGTHALCVVIINVYFMIYTIINIYIVSDDALPSTARER